MDSIVILKPMTKAEQAVSNAHQTLLHLDLCRSYCNMEKWGLAKEALVAAQASLQHVDQEQINDPDLLRKLVVGFQKMGNRILFKE